MSLVRNICGLTLALAGTAHAGATLELPVTVPGGGGSAAGGVDGPQRTRVRLATLSADAPPATFYTEDLGTVTFAKGFVYLRLGRADPEGFAAAVGLDGHPDDNRLLGDVEVLVDTCSSVRNGACESWVEHRLPGRLGSLPTAVSALSVPLSGLPPEVVLECQLDALNASFESSLASEAAARATADGELTSQAADARRLIQIVGGSTVFLDQRMDVVETTQADQGETLQLVGNTVALLEQDLDDARASHDQLALEVAALARELSLVKARVSRHLVVRRSVEICGPALSILTTRCPEGYLVTGCSGSLDRGDFIGTKPSDDLTSCESVGVGNGVRIGDLPCATLTPSHLSGQAICLRVDHQPMEVMPVNDGNIAFPDLPPLDNGNAPM